MARYKKLLIALAAVASLLIVRETGLDKGLIDDVLDGLIEAVVGEPEAAPEVPAGPEAPASTSPSLRDDQGQGALEQEQEDLHDLVLPATTVGGN